MPDSIITFLRTIDLPPIIVWDALVDPDLLAGWLGDVRLTPAEPVRFEILWPGADARESTAGRVTLFEEPHRLRIETDNRGMLEFALSSIPGGFRGLGTELELRIDSAIDVAFATRVRTEWQTSLDRLERLLQGHPVDWNHHERSDGATGVGGTTGREVNSPH